MMPVLTDSRPTGTQLEIRVGTSVSDAAQAPMLVPFSASTGATTLIKSDVESAVVTAQFEVLADWWHADTDGLSSPSRKYDHPAYQRIINELGRAAIPHILRDLRVRGGSWFHALRALTQGPVIRDEDRGNVRVIKAAWLDWGRRHGLIES